MTWFFLGLMSLNLFYVAQNISTRTVSWVTALSLFAAGVTGIAAVRLS